MRAMLAVLLVAACGDAVPVITIQGRIVDHDGVGQPGLDVEIYANGRTLDAVGETITDTQGNFTVDVPERDFDFIDAPTVDVFIRPRVDGLPDLYLATTVTGDVVDLGTWPLYDLGLTATATDDGAALSFAAFPTWFPTDARVYRVAAQANGFPVWVEEIAGPTTIPWPRLHAGDIELTMTMTARHGAGAGFYSVIPPVSVTSPVAPTYGGFACTVQNQEYDVDLCPVTDGNLNNAAENFLGLDVHLSETGLPITDVVVHGLRFNVADGAFEKPVELHAVRADGTRVLLFEGTYEANPTVYIHSAQALPDVVTIELTSQLGSISVAEVAIW